jgi:hypothetical protein
MTDGDGNPLPAPPIAPPHPEILAAVFCKVDPTQAVDFRIGYDHARQVVYELMFFKGVLTRWLLESCAPEGAPLIVALRTDAMKAGIAAATDEWRRMQPRDDGALN